MTRSEAAALCLLNAAREVEWHGPGRHIAVCDEDAPLVRDVAHEVADQLVREAEALLEAEAEPVQLELFAEVRR